MLFNKITKAEDGSRHVRTFTDDRKRVFLQIDDVKIVETRPEFVFELADRTQVDAIHEENIKNAVENSEQWFGRSLTESTLKRAYLKDDVIGAEILENVKVFNDAKEVVEYDSIVIDDKPCSIILEYSGLWFAKKTFGPSWNIVQVKLAPEPTPDPEPETETFDETYPEDYMFKDE